MPQTTVISFFKYQGIRNKWGALGRMGRPPILNKDIKGLSFWKTLGVGSGNGFSIWPDFSLFSLLSVFASEADAQGFLDSELMKIYTDECINYSHVLMHTVKAHGEWSSQSPFQSSTDYDSSKPIAVITRATIKPSLVHKFWRYVPSVSKSMNNYKGLIFTKGIGEYPIFMQATFSFWESGNDMMAYAYQNEKHAAMVKKTRELGWYSEELFARFQPFKIKGNLIEPSINMAI